MRATGTEQQTEYEQNNTHVEDGYGVLRREAGGDVRESDHVADHDRGVRPLVRDVLHVVRDLVQHDLADATMTITNTE